MSEKSKVTLQKYCFWRLTAQNHFHFTVDMLKESKAANLIFYIYTVILSHSVGLCLLLICVSTNAAVGSLPGLRQYIL